jgi:hypothetical protein
VTGRNGVIALAVLALALGIIWGISVLGNLVGGDCMSGSDSASCPALAEVNGVRYSVSASRGVVIGASDLTAYGPITRTNVPGHFSELTAYALTGVAPGAVLAAPATDLIDSPYRLLTGPDRASAFPALCRYFNATEQARLAECTLASPAPQ